MASLLEIGALALLAKAFVGSKSSAPAAPAPPPQQPPGGGGNIGQQLGGALGTLGGAIGTAILGGGGSAVAGGGVGAGVGGGVITTAATTSAATTGAEVGSQVAEYSLIGTFSAGSIAGTAAAVAFIIGIIVASAVDAAVEQYHSAVRQLLGYDIRAGSYPEFYNRLGIDMQHSVQQLLRIAVTDSTTQTKVSQYKSSLPPAVLQKAIATCIAMGFERAEARNTAVANFFSHLGELPQDVLASGSAIPPASYDFDSMFCTPFLQGGEGGSSGNPMGLTKGPFARHTLRNAGVESITGSDLCSIPVWTRSQVHDIALELLGQSNYDACAKVMRFVGSSYGVIHGAIAGYTIGWPGDQSFVRGLSDRTVNGQWPLVAGPMPVPTASAWQEMVDTAWLQDPETGFLVAPITSRERSQLIISAGPNS